jgi:cysteine desulfurase
MIYADFNGSSLPLPEVIEHLTNRLQKGPFGNPNAIHSLGQKLNAGLSKCRRHCSKVLGCEANQIVFNSGASEGISHVFFSVLNKKKIEKKHIIISSIEHSAVINAAKYYEDYGYTLHYLGVDGNGVVKIDELKSLLEKHKDDVALVSVMAANNETGVIQPYREIGNSVMRTILYFSLIPLNTSGKLFSTLLKLIWTLLFFQVIKLVVSLEVAWLS